VQVLLTLPGAGVTKTIRTLVLVKLYAENQTGRFDDLTIRWPLTEPHTFFNPSCHSSKPISRGSWYEASDLGLPLGLGLYTYSALFNL
jgi:hypothetical protein